MTDKTCFSKSTSWFELAIHRSLFSDRLFLLADHFTKLFVIIRNQNFPFVRTLVFRETTKFLFTLQTWQFFYILLQKVLNCTLLSCIWVTFWSKLLGTSVPNSQWRSLQHSPIPPNCWKNSQSFPGSILKRYFEPCAY